MITKYLVMAIAFSVSVTYCMENDEPNHALFEAQLMPFNPLMPPNRITQADLKLYWKLRYTESIEKNDAGFIRFITANPTAISDNGLPFDTEAYFYEILRHRNKKEMIRALLENHHNSIHSSRSQFSLLPLHWVCARGRLEYVEMFLENNVDPNSASKEEGNRPLHFAAYYGHGAVVERLLKGNADKQLPNNRGVLPNDLVILQQTDPKVRKNSKRLAVYQHIESLLK